LHNNNQTADALTTTCTVMWRQH